MSSRPPAARGAERARRRGRREACGMPGRPHRTRRRSRRARTGRVPCTSFNGTTCGNEIGAVDTRRVVAPSTGFPSIPGASTDHRHTGSAQERHAWHPTLGPTPRRSGWSTCCCLRSRARRTCSLRSGSPSSHPADTEISITRCRELSRPGAFTATPGPTAAGAGSTRAPRRDTRGSRPRTDA